jgi:4-hydroxy-tetrahydrodipicolinate synthase
MARVVAPQERSALSMSADGTKTKAWTWDAALQGIVPPMISPLSATGEVDDKALALVVNHILGGGCSGLFVLGGCGEGAWLTREKRSAVIRAATRAAEERAPVLAGLMLPATGPAIEAARQAADDGADALVVGSPYYFSVDAAAQQRHVEAILAAVPLPLLLYNIPQATHNPLRPETVAPMAQERRMLGIKDSAGDFEAFQGFLAIKKRRADFRVLQGNEHFASASLLLRGDGLVPGMANFAPALFVALHRAAAVGDAAACVSLQEEIADLCTLHTHGHWLPALKAACAMLRLGNGIPSPPLLPATAEQRRAIAAILTRHGFQPTP